MSSSSLLAPLPDCDEPIFLERNPEYTTLYAPGCVLVVAPEWEEMFLREVRGKRRTGWEGMLRSNALGALTKAELARKAPFEPLCLTLYLHNACNLRCTYCYTDPANQADVQLDPDAVAAAAENVADHCNVRGLPITAVFHGGGEPTLYPEQVEHLLRIIGRAAARRGLDVFRYVATNGVMSLDGARWLADRFDLIGLSCDGPPSIQNRNRPTAGGGDSAEALERTAAVLRQRARPFHVRVTITPETLDQQTAIAAYLCEVLAPAEIHFEPVYQGGLTGSGALPTPEAAQAFVAHFIQAQAEAARWGIPLQCSASRPESLHGPYCNVFKQVLNLNASGQAVACFKQVAGGDTVIGGYDPDTRRFTLQPDRIADLREVLGALPAGCETCFNRYHCTLGCPDRCGLDGPTAAVDGFRCQVARALALHTIRATAAQLWQNRAGAMIDATTLV